jgi:hypothetical protein
MIDVNKITSTLAKLPDQQLQQYAQMHKSDPYIMALAMSESNRRKEMRASGQGGQGMQEQPKVVDQMVAEMAPQQLPEDQGIGQLPAGEMNFAGGGIVAFADGGDVERYQDKGLVFETPYDRMNRLNREEAARRAAQGDAPLDEQAMRDREFLSNMFSSVRGGAETIGRAAADVGTIIPRSLARAYDTVAVRPMRAAGVNAAYLAPKLTPEGASAGSATPFTDLATARSAAKQDIAARDRDSLSEQQAAAVVAAAQPRASRAPGAAPTADTTRKGPRPAPTDKAAPTTDTNTQDKGVSGLDALVKDFTRSTELAQGALRNQRVGLASQLEQEALGTKEEGEKRRKERGDVFASRETRLAAREGELTGMKDKHFGLALLQAGAAMMTTPGNLGVALGKGVQVGSERYIAGIDKINAAKDKFAEARDRLDDLRLNRDDMNEKEVRDENRAIRNARIQGQQLFVDGATKDLEISNANQKAIFGVAAENIIADKRIKSAENISANELKTRERIAQIPQGQERLAMLLGGGDLAKGLAKFTEIQAGKFNPTTAYTDYISKRKEGDTVLTPQEFVTQIRSIQALMGKSPPTAVDTSKPDRQ